MMDRFLRWYKTRHFFIKVSSLIILAGVITASLMLLSTQDFSITLGNIFAKESKRIPSPTPKTKKQQVAIPSVDDVQQGIIEVIIYDPADYQTNPEARSEISCWLVVNDGSQMRLPGPCDTSMAGASVQLKDGKVFSISKVQPVTVDVTGRKTLAVILTNFEDIAPIKPFTKSQVEREIFDSNNYLSVSRRLYAESFNKISLLEGRVYDWVTVPVPRDSSGNPITDCQRKGKMAAKVAKERAVGSDNFDYYMFIFPSFSASCPGGWAVFGGTESFLTNEIIAPTLAIHELGHNFGLSHSNLLLCSEDNINLRSCAYEEYGDQSDYMGNNGSHFNIDSQNKLGWIPADQIQIVERNSPQTTFNLRSAGNSAGLRALYIPLRDDTGYSYELEYRDCCYFPYEDRGLYIRLVRPNFMDASGLLADGFHSFLIPAGSRNGVALTQPGQSFKDSIHNIKITLVRKKAGELVVKLDLKDNKPSVDIKGTRIDVTMTDAELEASFEDGPITVAPDSIVAVKIGALNVDQGSCRLRNLENPGQIIEGKYEGTFRSFPIKEDRTIVFSCKDLDGNTLIDTFMVKIGDEDKDKNCKRKDAKITVSPVRKSGSAGATLRYDVNVKNRDEGPSCEIGEFSVQPVSLPPMLEFKSSYEVFELGPGEEKTMRLRIKSRSGVPRGDVLFSLGVFSIDGTDKEKEDEAEAIYEIN